MALDVNGVPTGGLTVDRLISRGDTRTGVKEITMTGTFYVQPWRDPSHLFFDDNGSDRDIVLPQGEKGMAYFLMHVGDAQTLTVKNKAGTTLTKIDASNATMTTGQFLTVFYTGTTWRVV